MKRPIEALIVMDLVAAIVAVWIASPWGVARAEPPAPRTASPVVKLAGSARLTRPAPVGGVAAPAKFHVTATFSTDPPGEQLLTVQRAVIFFPDHSGTNGRLFPSCDAKRIARFHGNANRCPKGSRIGSGSVRARAIQLGIFARGRVALFSSHRGKSITFNIQTDHPAAINQSIDAPLAQLHGKYGEKLTLVVPHSLQEIVSGLFVGVQTFDVTISGAVVAHGIRYSFLKAPTCPKRALHGVFGFVDGGTGRTATATADAKVRCSAG